MPTETISIDELRNQLTQIRLEEDLTYQELATLIGLPSHSPIHRFINIPGWQPNARTVYKMRRFLLNRREEQRPRRRGGIEVRA
jgi:outer membrane protein TolC